MRFASKLHFGDKTQQVANTALRLVQRMKRDSIHSGRRPSGLCGAALLIAARLHDFGRSPGDIVKIVKVHETTLRKRLIEFGDTPSSALTLDEFMSVDLEEEQDPPSFKAARKKDKERLQKLMEEEDETFTDLQKQIENQLEKNTHKRRLEPRNESPFSEELDDTDKFIKESTLGTVNELLQSEVIDDPDEVVKELGPDINSMGLVNSLEDVGNSVQTPQELTIDLSFEDIDDAEIDTYIMSDAEYERKKKTWFTLNGGYLELQKMKAEKLEKEREEGKPEKKRKRTTKKKTGCPASSAGEAIEKIIQEKKISSKINYDVLKSLKVAPVAANDETVTVEDQTAAVTSESTKRRRLSLLPTSLEKTTSRGNKNKLKDVGLPFFQDSPKMEVKNEVGNKMLKKEHESEILKKDEQANATSEEELDEYFEDEDQPTEEPANVLDLLRQHRQNFEEDDGQNFGYGYDYDEEDY
nr:transcription factor IIIB 90 kDa subunit-like [Leptinotarsa decemlineata]